MIDDLLEVTQLEAGKLSVELEGLSVRDALTDTLNTLQETARAKGVSVTCELPADLPAAHADRTRLRQILIILLDNALKFTAGGGTVRLQAELLRRDPRFLMFAVSDTGCGMSSEIRRRIFERLYQVPELNEPSRRGLGLGLFICKELVTRQGGHIWVDSQPERGSTFSFTLPVFSPDHPPAPIFNASDREPFTPQVIPEPVYHE
jgi:two-component system phosphate regulon sensor histidine kinase PhoR